MKNLKRDFLLKRALRKKTQKKNLSEFSPSIILKRIFAHSAIELLRLWNRNIRKEETSLMKPKKAIFFHLRKEGPTKLAPINQ